MVVITVMCNPGTRVRGLLLAVEGIIGNPFEGRGGAVVGNAAAGQSREVAEY
jgi:hypothetical protein